MRDMTEIEEGLHADTLSELRAAGIESGRPLIAVDADDVLVVFVDHLSRWMETRGFRMHLESYQLEGSMFPADSDRPLPFEDCIALINDFFDEETEGQQAVPGGLAALRALEDAAQVVILTNVPRHAAAARAVNLRKLGLTYPLIINSGGKGRAMAWLAATADAQVAMVDDSVTQLESVARHVPESIRLHFAGAEHIRRLYPSCAHATEQVRDWSACGAALRRLMKLG